MRSSEGGLLFYGFDVDRDLDVIADHARSVGDSEVTAIYLRLGFPAGKGFSARARSDSEQLGFKGDLLRDIFDGEVAHDAEGVLVDLGPGLTLERDGGEFTGEEEVLGVEVSVAFLLVGVDARGLNQGFRFAGRRIGGVKGERSFKFRENSRHLRNEVSNGEPNGGVGGIDFPRIRGRTARDSEASEGQRENKTTNGANFHKHYLDFDLEPPPKAAGLRQIASHVARLLQSRFFGVKG